MTDKSPIGHGNNIQHKLRTAGTPELKAIIEDVNKLYVELKSKLNWTKFDTGWLDDAVRALNEYTEYLKVVEKKDKFFNWRGDFASSLLPEFLYLIVHRRLQSSGISALYSTRGSIVDVTLSGYRDGGWSIRRKNQDLCIGLRKDKISDESGEVEFVVPMVAVEAKTNIDINKLNGLDFSAERLKRTFPASKYFLVTETLDFALDRNYAGSIDEIFVLRKQMRSAARKSRDAYHADVFEAFVEDVAVHISRADMSRSHVYSRLTAGRLINV